MCSNDRAVGGVYSRAALHLNDRAAIITSLPETQSDDTQNDTNEDDGADDRSRDDAGVVVTLTRALGVAEAVVINDAIVVARTVIAGALAAALSDGAGDGQYNKQECD